MSLRLLLSSLPGMFLPSSVRRMVGAGQGASGLVGGVAGGGVARLGLVRPQLSSDGSLSRSLSGCFLVEVV
jgi:hypothetical protein